ncbi:hypothetical protein T310_2465 [Rasamsonia emersonii CBS 393.64]|uniref:PIN domain-containing protein n=1 Tax=Rasamsonia emersonii (strain ATCC 16479 / CBS 393.64 / IMI 116815) TaxID=1408163 RepID=A0A0F4Z075_RASE3|nr:hypothetical protein T310_2465 [Rasamsonia emersonii CBS 393.64]KKA23496.1 hypothetical protein T310_2465 [Rasamsonia emersonii CBS 393.64]
MSTGRKVFHCAVDDTVLTTNISEIKKWTSNGAITLFVPLYTLERLRAPKRGGSQLAINAREAVRFLDRVTSGKDSIPPERITLQGPMEQYETWAEAEKFFLPEFEEEPEESHEVVDDVSTSKVEEDAKPNGHAKGVKDDDLSQMLLSKLNFKKEPDADSMPSTGTHSGPASRSSSRSSHTSPEYADGNVTKSKSQQTPGHQRSASNSSIPATPTVLRPLLSALLWRLHSSPDTTGPARSVILVTNDRFTQTWAQKFGITTKNIHQLRTAIQYEEKEYKNRCKYAEKIQAAAAADPKPLFSYENDSDEDELVFVPRGRGKGAARGVIGRGGNGRKSAASKPAVVPPVETTVEIPTEPIDPDSFNRSLGVSTTAKKLAVDLSSQAGAARGLAASSRRHGGGRRGGGARGGSSGRGGSRGRGKLWVP